MSHTSTVAPSSSTVDRVDSQRVANCGRGCKGLWFQGFWFGVFELKPLKTQRVANPGRGCEA